MWSLIVSVSSRDIFCKFLLCPKLSCFHLGIPPDRLLVSEKQFFIGKHFGWGEGFNKREIGFQRADYFSSFQSDSCTPISSLFWSKILFFKSLKINLQARPKIINFFHEKIVAQHYKNWFFGGALYDFFPSSFHTFTKDFFSPVKISIRQRVKKLRGKIAAKIGFLPRQTNFVWANVTMSGHHITPSSAVMIYFQRLQIMVFVRLGMVFLVDKVSRSN